MVAQASAREESWRRAVGLALGLAGAACCSSPVTPERSPPLSPPLGASASAAPSASASIEPAAPPARPTLGDPNVRELEAMLRDVCEVVYLARKGGGFAVGCGGCDLPSPFEPGAFSIVPLPEGCSESPHCEGAEAGWTAQARTLGAFTAAGAEEALLALGGSCNPKHGGSLLLRREQGHWSVVELYPGGAVYGCLTLPRADGRDLLVCVEPIRSVFGDLELGRVVGVGGAPSQPLFSIEHGDGKLRCLSAADRKLYLSGKLPVPAFVSEVFVAATEAKDTNGDARADLVVQLVEKRLPSTTPEAWLRVEREGELAAQHTLTFLNDGATVKPDAATKQKLTKLCGTPEAP